MKILMATMQLDIGGAETHIVELAKQLKVMGHDIAIISNGGVYVKEIEEAGIRHYKAPLHRRSAVDMMKALPILRDVIRREAPDVVHAHARIPAFLCGLLHKTMKFPFVTTAHWVFDSKGMLRHLTNWGQRTVAVSDDIKAYLIREYGLDADHISVTINGIDTEKFSPAVSGESVIGEFGLDPARPILSYVSRMDEDRALVARQLIEIAPLLDKEVPGVQLLIAGGGNVYDELLKKAGEVNAAMGRTCITMTGARTDINKIVAAGEVFVGVSRAALEAMAAAKPVIVAGNEGYHGLFTAEKLEEAQAGNFCCRGLPMSTPEMLLRDTAAALKLSAEEKKAAGEYGRQVIFDYYSVRRMAGDCLAMYEQVYSGKHRVVVSGYYGFNNAGDDAILESLQENIRAISDEVELTVLSKDPELTRKQFGLKAVPRFDFWKVVSALKNCDLLLSGGGSLMQDTTSTRSLLYYLSVICGARLLGKPVMLYANGIGPVRRPMNRRLVRSVVEKAAAVTLRDHSSEQELRAMGVKRPDLFVTADPVFRLEPDSRERAQELIRRSGIPMDRPFVIVSVRDWEKASGFPKELAPVCDHLRRSHGLEVLFLLMQPRNDSEMTQRVRSAMTEPSYILESGCTPREIMAVLGEAKLCLAMRLHTLIFAAKVATPTLGLVYDPKVESYLAELALPSSGDVERYKSAKAMEECDKLLANYDAVLESLKTKSRVLYENTEKNDILLLELLKKTK